MSTEPETTVPSVCVDPTQLSSDYVRLTEVNAALQEGNAALKQANNALQELVSSLQRERALMSNSATYPTQDRQYECASSPEPVRLTIFINNGTPLSTWYYLRPHKR